MTVSIQDPRRLLQTLLDGAVDAAQPARCLPPCLAAVDPHRFGRTIVLGAGKAAAAMAHTVETVWPDIALSGLVVTRYGHAVPCDAVDVVEAAHPVPDKAGADAARRILAAAADAGEDDLVLFLLSGGASALLSLPRPGVSLEDKRIVTRALLAAGADIGEINAVRKHLSDIKGGRLAQAAAPATLVTLAISDVIGDDPAVIGSGPTVADPTTLDDARDVIARYAIDAPRTVLACLNDPASETLKPGDPALAASDYRLAATPRMALEAAVHAATQAGISVDNLGDSLDGDAASLGKSHGALVRAHLASGHAVRPHVFISGGEATVTVRGKGKGGPNTEYLLALAAALDGLDGVWALAADTDGADGSEDNAGAIVTPDTIRRARASGLHPDRFLADNDAWSFFDSLGDLVVTGPTHTNVNDFRAILIVETA